MTTSVRSFMRPLVLVLLVVVVVASACGGASAPATSSTAATAAPSVVVTKIPFDYEASLLQKGRILAATSGTSPPRTMTNSSGQLEGYDIDRCNAIGKRLGLEVKYVVVDFASTLAGLSSGRFDMTCTGVSKTPERDSSADFLMTAGNQRNATTVVARTDDNTIKSIMDCKGKAIGGVRGGQELKNVVAYLNNQADVREYPGYTELMLDLKNKRIDCYSANLLGAAFQVKGDSALRLVDKTGIALLLVGEAVRKQEPELLKAVNAVEQEMLGNGQLSAMQVKWFGVETPPSGR